VTPIVALAPGSWAEWVGGVGTILAFGATAGAVWQGHLLQRTEHREAMYDEALKVTAQPGQGSKPVLQELANGPRSGRRRVVTGRGKRAAPTGFEPVSPP
jgi:hypothetical protein